MKTHEPYRRLKGALREKELKYEDLARLLNVSATSISHKINGKSDFSLKQAMQIQEYVGIDIKNF